ncbi:hypothetical protein ABT381_26375 [Streptomyces sp. NPDC000151]|uniref:hypothetical protein n=1 Tax=Streptomyces sp. NPDC000151 TaxID=3154244 RepID=UPI00332436F3
MSRRPWCHHTVRVASGVVLLLAAMTGCAGQTTQCNEGAVCGNDNAVEHHPTQSTTRASSSAPASPSSGGASAESAVGPPAAGPATASSAPSEKRSAADECTSWRAIDAVPGVEARPCWRRDGDKVYLVAQWRSDRQTHIDVYLWLKDAAGDRVVYANGKEPWSWSRLNTADTSRCQYPVGVALKPGTTYNVSLSVKPHPSDPPYISNPAVDGFQMKLEYT